MNAERPSRPLAFYYFPAVLLAAAAVALIVARGATSSAGVRAELSPFYAVLQPRLSIWAVSPLVVFAVALAVAVPLARRPAALQLAALVAFFVGFALTLELAPGGPAAMRPSMVGEYLADAPRVYARADWWVAYDELAPTLRPHARVHPPGVFAYLEPIWALGGRDARAVGVVNAVVGALALVPIYFLGRVLYDRGAAYWSCWLVALSPAATRYASSFDALNVIPFAIAALAAFHLAMRPAWRPALAFGVAAAVGVLLTYQLLFAFLLLAALAVAPLVARRLTARHILWGAAAAGVFALALAAVRAASGFDAVASFHASFGGAQRVASGGPNVVDFVMGMLGKGAAKGGHRSYLLWVVGNPVAFFITLGVPAAVLYFRRLATEWRGRADASPAFLFNAAALAALVLFDLSGFTLGEVERVWLYLTPLVAVPAAAALARLAEERGNGVLTFTLAFLFVQSFLYHVLLHPF